MSVKTIDVIKLPGFVFLQLKTDNAWYKRNLLYKRAGRWRPPASESKPKDSLKTELKYCDNDKKDV